MTNAVTSSPKLPVVSAQHFLKRQRRHFPRFSLGSEVCGTRLVESTVWGLDDLEALSMKHARYQMAYMALLFWHRRSARPSLGGCSNDGFTTLDESPGIVIESFGSVGI